MNKSQLLEELKLQGITDKNILKAIDKVPRELFIPKSLRAQAYENIPLPIGKAQTISQPYTIAIMLQALELKKSDKVLEIGTGSGYNAALIQEITKTTVYTTEIIPELVKFSKENLKKAKISRVKVFYYDGSRGFPKYAPYNAIILTAGCPEIPPPLINQLKDSGRLIAPVGQTYTYSQTMIKLIKKGNKLIKEELGNFVFVPLTGKFGY